MHPETKNLHHAVRDGVTRAVGAIGLAGVALIHLLDVPGKFSETAYMGWRYIGLMVGSLATAFALVRGSWSPAWGAALLLPAGALAGYVLLERALGLAPARAPHSVSYSPAG
jgi:hypothetical protein